jgi:outer membrane lipoprotein carrier protein
MTRHLVSAVTLALAAAVAGSTGLVRAQASQAAADLAKQIQTHYDTVKDFRAGFTHTYTSGVLGEKVVERGDVKIKKPNRMSWAYTTPTKNFYIADGAQFFHYTPTPGDQQCSVNPLPSGDNISIGILFLAGRGSLVRDFTSALPAEQPDGAWRLNLVPKAPQDDFVALSVVVDRRTFALQTFMTTDREKNTNRFDFSGLKENVGLKDSEFTFTPPRGVRCQAPRP